MLNQKYIISEFYDFSAKKGIIEEAEKLHKPIVLKGILQKADTENRNGRVYPYNILKREADNYQEIVNDRRGTGELDHPDSAVVSLSNVSHMVTEMWWEGKTLYGKVELVNTPAGDILKGLLKSGVKLGISSRGIGSVKKVNENDVVQDDFELIAFDFVSSPSTPGAYLFKESKNWGLTKLTNEHIKVIKTSDLKDACNIISEVKENDKYKKLLDISKDSFWSI